MEKDEKIHNENDVSQIGNVDQIREILFGAQSRELKEKFDKIEKTLNTMNTDLQQKIQQNKDDISNRITNEIENLSRKIKNVTSLQQQEFTDIRDIALKQDARVQNSLEILEEEFHTKNDQLKKEQIQHTDDIRKQMDHLQNEMLQTLNDKISEMGYEKLSRDDAANIMMEAAMGMKGMSIDKQLSLAKEDN